MLKSAYGKYSIYKKNRKQVIDLVFNLLTCTVKLQIIVYLSNILLLRYPIASLSICQTLIQEKRDYMKKHAAVTIMKSVAHGTLCKEKKQHD